jgi:hypothetical protein
MATPQEPVAGQPADQPTPQPPRQEMRLRLDERELRASYANAFRTNTTGEEVMLDFGVNLVNTLVSQDRQPEMVFQVGERIILNYFTAKRLALALGHVIRHHEEQFGELELDMAKRRKA